MRSSLTRSVFRRIISTAVHTEVPYWQLSSAQDCLRRRTSRNTTRLPTIPRRSLFGFTRSKPAQSSQDATESAYEVLAQLDSQLSQGIRPAPPEEVAKAFIAFFEEKVKSDEPIEDVQVQQVQRAFEYLQKSQDEMNGLPLMGRDITIALKVLAIEPKSGRSGAHLQLATKLFEELERRRSTGPEPRELDGGVAHGTEFGRGVGFYITILSRMGQTRKARDLLESYWDSGLKEGGDGLWVKVLRGFISEANDDELSETIALMATHNVAFSFNIHRVIIMAYARTGDLEAVKKWYDHPIANGGTPNTVTYAVILELCIRKNEYDWGERIFRSSLDKLTPNRTLWGLILRWSAAKGKGLMKLSA